SSFARLARVGPPGIELLADQPELIGSRRRRARQRPGDLRLPARRRPDVFERGARMQAVDAHLAGLVEVPDREIRDDHGWAAPDPALLAPDPLRYLRPTEVARRRSEVDVLDERARRLAHDHEHLPRV